MSSEIIMRASCALSPLRPSINSAFHRWSRARTSSAAGSGGLRLVLGNVGGSKPRPKPHCNGGLAFPLEGFHASLKPSLTGRRLVSVSSPRAAPFQKRHQIPPWKLVHVAGTVFGGYVFLIRIRQLLVLLEAIIRQLNAACAAAQRQTVPRDLLKRCVHGAVRFYLDEQVAVFDVEAILFGAGGPDDPTIQYMARVFRRAVSARLHIV